MKIIIVTSILDVIFHAQDGLKFNSGWFYSLRDSTDEEIIQELHKAFTEDSGPIKHIQSCLEQARQDNRVLTKESSIRDIGMFVLKLKQASKLF